MTDLSKPAVSNTPNRWLLVVTPIAIMAIIFALSSRSHLPELDGGRGFQSVAGHFTVYAALGASLTVLFRSLGWSPARAMIAAIVLATLYGVTDEFHQWFVPNRTTDPFDVLVDFLGATVGSSLMLVLIDRRASVSARSDAAPDRPADGSF